MWVSTFSHPPPLSSDVSRITRARESLASPRCKNAKPSHCRCTAPSSPRDSKRNAKIKCEPGKEIAFRSGFRAYSESERREKTRSLSCHRSSLNENSDVHSEVRINSTAKWKKFDRSWCEPRILPLQFPLFRFIFAVYSVNANDPFFKTHRKLLARNFATVNSE